MLAEMSNSLRLDLTSVTNINCRIAHTNKSQIEPQTYVLCFQELGITSATNISIRIILQIQINY